MAIQRPGLGVELRVQIGRLWAALLLGSLLLVRQSSQLPLGHPLRAVVDVVNERGPFLGVVMAYPAEAEALQSSGVFTPSPDVPCVELSGRSFHVGTIRDVGVIYVMSGQRRLNAGITVQILTDVFNIRGIVHYGTAGSSNSSLSFGDVSVPKFVAFTGSWQWMKFNGLGGGQLTELSIGSYNVPSGGENLLSEIKFKTEEFFSVGHPMEEVFWLQTDPEWFQIAQQLQDLKLQRCVNETYCLPQAPKVVIGLKGATADIFVDNAAYRNFLFQKFQVSTVDEESSAVVMTAMSTGLPSIVVRGVSDLAGGDDDWSSTSLSTLASSNSLAVAVEFIRLIRGEKAAAAAGPKLEWPLSVYINPTKKH